MESETAASTAHPTAVDRPGRERLWGESWYFDAASSDGTCGAFVRIGDYPHLGVRWTWAYVADVAGARGTSVTTELPSQRDGPWTTRAGGLELEIRPRGDAWELSAEGEEFALDLRWTPAAVPYEYTRGHRLEQAGRARGWMRAGESTVPLDGPGQRDHSWGVRDWWRFGWTWCAGGLDDGSRFQATILDARGRLITDGYLDPPDGGRRRVSDVAVSAHAVRLEDTTLEFSPVSTVTLELCSPAGARTWLHRDLTRVCTDDGRGGVGWRERNVPGDARAPSAWSPAGPPPGDSV